MSNNFIKGYDGNKLVFRENGVNRPLLQDYDEDEYTISNLSNGAIFLDRKDIDDLIILLEEIKNSGL